MFRIASTIAVAGLVGSAALIAASPAQADEGQYLADLAQAGFGSYNAGQALQLGHAVCAAEAQGESHNAAVNEVYGLTSAGIGPSEAAFIVESAELFLC